MNLEDLNFIDYLLVGSLVITLVIGFLPNVISTKNSNDKISMLGIFMLVFFLIGVFMTLISTILKSSADKKAYTDLFDSTTLVLKRANNNIKKSDSILDLQNKNINELKTLQENAKQIQKQGILLTYKSDLIQAKSEQLNRKLLEEIYLQKSTTKIADSIVDKITTQDRNTERNNQLRLLLCITSMRKANFILYNGMQQVGTNYDDYVMRLVTEYNNELSKFRHSQTNGDSLKNNSKNYNANAAQIIDAINNVISIYIADLHRNVIYAIKDSATLTKAITQFLDQNIALLDSQLGNPIIQKNSKLVDIWVAYFRELNTKRSTYFLDKLTLNSIAEIRQLTKSQDEFVKQVEKNTKLEVVLDNK